MAKHLRSRAELEALMKEQAGFLRSSARAFDGGDHAEAKRLATTTYTLVHDGGRSSVSLLTHLGLRASAKFFDSRVREISESSIPWMPLTAMTFADEKAIFVPLCQIPGLAEARAPEEVQFMHWWDAPVFKTADGLKLNRKNLVFSLRSQDGGSHVDGTLSNDAYHTMITKNDERITSNGKPLENAHLATMRQIAWEIEQTIRILGY